MKTFIKGALSIIATTAIVSGIVYAVPTITSVMTQPMSSGSIVGAGWFQDINDKVLATANLWTKPYNTTISNNDVLVNGSIVISKGGSGMSFDPTIGITFPDGTIQRTAAVSGGNGGATTDCNEIITKADRIACYAGRGSNLPQSSMISGYLPFFGLSGGEIVIPLSVCNDHSFSYKAWAVGSERLEVQNLNGELWVVGVNFPVPIGNTGHDLGDWNCGYWDINPTITLICDISYSSSCTSSNSKVGLQNIVVNNYGFSITTNFGRTSVLPFSN